MSAEEGVNLKNDRIGGTKATDNPTQGIFSASWWFQSDAAVVFCSCGNASVIQLWLLALGMAALAMLLR